MIQMIRLGALTFALVLAAGVAVAEHHEGGRSGRDAHKWGHGNSHTSSVLKHADELGLDDATRAKIREITDAARESGKERREKTRALDDDMRDLMAQDTPDEAAIMAAADRLGALSTEARKAKISSSLKVRALLSPEQSAQLKQIREARHGRRHDGKGHEGCDGECPVECSAEGGTCEHAAKRCTRHGKSAKGAKEAK
jgi:Spy/CpxP family protein refolding chaperone